MKTPKSGQTSSLDPTLVLCGQRTMSRRIFEKLIVIFKQ